MTRFAVENVSLHSHIMTPIEKKSRLRQSLLFAELANLLRSRGLPEHCLLLEVRELATNSS